MTHTDTVKIEAAFHAAEKVLGMPKETLKEKSRDGEIVEAKRFFMYFLRWNSNVTLAHIGKKVNRSHSDVIHHSKKHIILSETERNYATRYQLFEQSAFEYIEQFNRIGAVEG